VCVQRFDFILVSGGQIWGVGLPSSEADLIHSVAHEFEFGDSRIAATIHAQSVQKDKIAASTVVFNRGLLVLSLGTHTFSGALRGTPAHSKRQLHAVEIPRKRRDWPPSHIEVCKRFSSSRLWFAS